MVLGFVGISKKTTNKFLSIHCDSDFEENYET